MFKKLFDKTLIKFLIVGVINTLFGAGIMFLFYNWLHLGYWVSSASNYVFGSILSFFLNKYYTFQSKKMSWGEIGRFVLSILVCYLAAYGIAKPLVVCLFSGANESLRDNIAMLTGMIIFTGLNYIGQRFFAFRKTDETEE